MNGVQSALTVHIAPLLPSGMMWGIAGVLAALAVLSLFLFRRGLAVRCLCALAFLTALMNPSLVTELRESVNDVAVIIADRSPSQDFGNRRAAAESALAELKPQLDALPGLETRVIDAPATESKTARETRLFEALEQALSDVPAARRAGVILLTDGQVHDIPDAAHHDDYGPVHTLLTGRRDEIDRQLVVAEAPAYGIVGQSVDIRYRVEDHGKTGQEYASMIIRVGNNEPQLELVPVGEEQVLTVPIDHAGQNIVSIEASPVDRELTAANNKAPLIVNGVRDRLRVLLVSGKPHAGGRTWRNLLTSDPAVDLVHFTILREPDKLDATPQDELSLIAFPFRELFEIKLYDFDLIVFDQYSLNRILPNFYFANIAKYVQEGGALLEASGPSFSGPDSVYTTALADVLPGAPLGPVIERPFVPAVTPTGLRHPVTQDLDARHGKWGPWLRQVAVKVSEGDVLMEGVDKSPLLILNHVGKGRVAQLASDHIWLWSRGFMGGGPQAELLRRLAHWLMKEPELEENALNVFTDGATVTIIRRALRDDPVTVKVTAPDGTVREMTLEPHSDGVLRAQFTADSLGIYAVSDGEQQRFAVIGELNPPELRGVVTTDTLLAPLAAASGGSVHWLPHDGTPAPRMVAGQRTDGGRDWIGLRQNMNYTVTGVENTPVLPPWAYAAALLVLMIAVWWWEGRSRPS